MNEFIPLSVPNLRGNELNYVVNAVEEEWVSTGGEYINRFEKNIAEYLKIDNAVACQSGTAALHLSLIQSGVKYDDEVIVPTLTFIAAVNPVRYCNAHPVFMDCDDSLTMDTDKLERFLESECDFVDGVLINKHSKRTIKAIIVVHIFGNLADMEKIMSLAKRFNLKVIEDATEALGSYYTEGKYDGKFAGTIGDFGCYSFNGNKIITTGGGGMIVADSPIDLDKVRYLSTQAKNDVLNYVHNEIGYNYRMTNLQAALGVGQLERIEEFIEIKKNNYELYKQAFDALDGIRMLEFGKFIRPNYWFYSIVLEEDKLYVDDIIRELKDENIQTRPIWGLIHEQLPYKNDQSYDIAKAEYYHKRIINIPCSSNLEEEGVFKVIEKIKTIVSNKRGL
ncbi:LegC family aminotransferase [Clostridium butyricum]|uniref:LegC family aminotransferase n=1 Tax=Clostridium butyricum TaxID=1492 RepID=UPI0013D7B6EA|nr:LegC family aminotransferase [Clostridium butyricum]MCQ2022249.1 LegC family aminotransferase [Clostridium butyricum]NFB70115.1 LegC family aminotransferase [Clostridium butyricum]NFB89902.1 LegC family aminotransferase [Clostridium butyricum]